MRYEFRLEDARRFADMQGITVVQRGNELHFRKCPYCRETTDDRNTFAINTDTGMFKCLRASCGAHGNMITLARDFDFSLGTEIDEYYRPSKKYRNMRKYPRPATREPAVVFMKSRGISREITESYSITTKEGQDNIICFPFYDENNVLQFVKYRKSDFNKDRDNNKEWCLSKCKPILFGMDHCSADMSDVLILTEGQIDSLSVAEAFCGAVNVVSVPTGAKGFTWVPHCWDFLRQFNELIIFGDHEDDKITLLEEMKTRFHGKICHVRPEDYRGCKDANELLLKYGRKAIQEAIENAVPVKNERILDISTIQRKSAVEDSIDTGIRQLNRLTGGFPLGRLAVITGQSGKGKSTLAMQFAVRAVEQGYKVFCYSGELNDWEVAKQLDRQVAGRKYLEEHENRSGFKEYEIKEEYKETVTEWTKNKFYLYNNSIIEEDEDESHALIRTVQDAVRQYDCRVVILDNLMTAMMDDLNLDLYRQQTRFVMNLHNMASSMNIFIMLIAHRRKSQGNQFQNDDIAGSSNIINLVDMILQYGEPVLEKGEVSDARHDGDRILQLTKNRITGQLNEKGIKLWFDEASTRISETLTDFDWSMSWQSGKDGFQAISAEDLDEIPF